MIPAFTSKTQRRREFLLLCVSVSLWFSAFGATWMAALADGESDRVARLIVQLGSPRFTERESASRALDAIGEPALEALLSAAKSGDPETRRRASELAERIGQRVAVARLLRPTMITLSIVDQPIDAAVRQLAAATGLPIDAPNLPGGGTRKVTVRAGPISVWEAVELFCQKADLHEWDGLSPRPGAPTQPNEIRNNMGGRGIQVQGQVIVNGRIINNTASPPARVVLLNGPGPALARSRGGAVRVRLLPHGTPFPGELRADELVLPLQVSAESRLQWSGVLSVRVDRAIADDGQPIPAVGVLPSGPAGDVAPVMIINNAAVINPGGPVMAGTAAVKVQHGERAVRSLRELSGELTGQIRVTEPLVQVPAPLAAGAGATGSGGAEIKLIKADVEDGQWKLTVQTNLPIDFNGNAAFNGRVVFQGGVVVQQMGAAVKPAPLGSGQAEFNGLSLEDAQGRRWPAVAGIQESSQFSPQGVTTVQQVVFQSPAADATPARLILSGPRPVAVSVPFQFRDVPLP